MIGRREARVSSSGFVCLLEETLKSVAVTLSLAQPAVRVPDGSAHADGWFGPGRCMVRPTSIKKASLLNSASVDSTHGIGHANSGILNGEILGIVVLTHH